MEGKPRCFPFCSRFKHDQTPVHGAHCTLVSPRTPAPPAGETQRGCCPGQGSGGDARSPGRARRMLGDPRGGRQRGASGGRSPRGWWIAAPPPARTPGRGGRERPVPAAARGARGSVPARARRRCRRMSCGRPKDMEGTGRGRGGGSGARRDALLPAANAVGKDLGIQSIRGAALHISSMLSPPSWGSVRPPSPGAAPSMPGVCSSSLPRCCPCHSRGLPALDPQCCPLHPRSHSLHIPLYSPIPGRVCPRALPLVLWCTNEMGWKICLQQRDAGVRTGQAGLGVLEQGTTPGKSMSRGKGAHCRQGSQCLWAPTAASRQENLPRVTCPLDSHPLPSPHTLTLSNPTEVPCHGVLRNLLAVPMGVSGAQIFQRHTNSPQTLCPLPQPVPRAPIMLHREDRKDICLLFPSSSILRRHQQWAGTSLSSVPVRGSHLISASREFRGKCWGDTHHTQGLSQVHSRGIWRGWRGCESSLSLV